MFADRRMNIAGPGNTLWEKKMLTADRSRKGSWTLSLVLVAAVITGPLGCDQAAPEEPAGGPAGKKDGETLFRSIYFGVGPVAGQLPEMQARQQKLLAQPIDKAEAAQKFDRLASELEAKGSSARVADHFRRLATRLRSGKDILPRGNDVEAAAVLADQMTRYTARLKQADATFFSRFEAKIQSGDHLKVKEALNEGRQLLWQAMQVDIAEYSPGTENGAAWLAYESVVAFYVAAIFVVVVTQIDATPLLEVQSPQSALELDMTVDEIVRQLSVVTSS